VRASCGPVDTSVERFRAVSSGWEACRQRYRNPSHRAGFRLPEPSGRRDSNPRHLAWEASALPTELRPRGLDSTEFSGWPFLVMPDSCRNVTARRCSRRSVRQLRRRTGTRRRCEAAGCRRLAGRWPQPPCTYEGLVPERVGRDRVSRSMDIKYVPGDTAEARQLERTARDETHSQPAQEQTPRPTSSLR
jgi:hypothetical protein